MYAIYDDQTEDRLSDQESPTVEAAQEHMRTLLTRTREQVEATGDSAAGMVLEWSIRSQETGRPVAWHYGPPPTTAVYE
ncbi:hypothetical protein [Nocardiopsis tropica]|uniref:Uncharacterized protein n=1 Tax=Nocardiopsis tropica TaxID=109330 RepID=A0ABU7KR60_9ACTN|nr:hypothetical protein [Nocardiopsis umidischolae]MEE2051773.1 hypothetical protein [Nocardiopsis umidischolae]